MSVMINQHYVSDIAALSSVGQNVIKMLPAGAGLYSDFISDRHDIYHYKNELDFINDIWQGTQGTAELIMDKVNCWVTPTVLYYLEQDEQDFLANYTPKQKRKFLKLANKYQWFTSETLKQFTLLRERHLSLRELRWSNLSPQEIQQLLQGTASIDSDLFANALKFAQKQSINTSSLVNLTRFYLALANNLSAPSKLTFSQASTVLNQLKSSLGKYLQAPVLSVPPDESTLDKVQSDWLSNHPIFGFRDIHVGCRIIAELKELPVDNQVQLERQIFAAITAIQDFFASERSLSAFPDQLGKGWNYSFKNAEYSATLQWLNSGSLCLHDFTHLKPLVSKVTKKTTSD